MAGTFSKSNLPKRPGAYFNFQAKAPEPTLVNSLGTVALGFRHSWGPANQVVQLGEFGDFLSFYSRGSVAPAAVTPGYRAARDVFKGEDLPGFGGAGQVLAYRMCGSSAAPASKSLSNGTTGAITLTAVYPGVYGQQISVAVIADTADPTNKNDLVVYVEGIEVERFIYAKANITDLAAQINGTTPYTSTTKSDWLIASAVTSGTALTLVSATALTGGDDGATLTGTDYSAAMTAFEPYRFSVLAFGDLTDPTIIASLKTWAVNLNTRGKRFITVVGGAAAETMSAAVARSATLDDPNFANVGSGTYTDPDYGDISTAQLAPRIAGIIAARGEAQEITFARLKGLSIKQGNTDADVTNAIAGGVIAIARDSHPTAPVRLELGVTTYTDTTDSSRPLNIYGNLKFIRVMQSLEVELTEWAEENVIGKMQVNQATRDFIRGQMSARMAEREAAGIVQPGWVVRTDTNPPPTPTDTFVALVYEITLGRGLEQILNTVVVG